MQECGCSVSFVMGVAGLMGSLIWEENETSEIIRMMFFKRYLFANKYKTYFNVVFKTKKVIVVLHW